MIDTMMNAMRTQRKPKLILASYWGTKSVCYSAIYIKSLYYELKKRAKMAQAPQNQQYKQKGKVK